MPTFSIQHITRYQYDRPIKDSFGQLKIFPIEDDYQKLVKFDLQVTGDPVVAISSDFFGNKMGDFSLLPPHNELVIDSRCVVNTRDGWKAPIDNKCTIQDVINAAEKDLLLIWLSEPEKIASQNIIEQLLFETDISLKPVLEIAEACCGYIFKNFTYKKGITSVESTIDDILEHKSGVCQDFAHVLLQMLRTIGIPSRYVSGYICPNKSGMRGAGATHAWVEYYLPGSGWIGIDPTNNVFAGPYHVRLASGRHFADCTPVKGAFKGLAHQKLTVFVSVGFEDGHVFEDISNVELESTSEILGTLPWQDDFLAKQQQQQQQQQQ